MNNLKSVFITASIAGAHFLSIASAELFFSESFDYGPNDTPLANVSDWTGSTTTIRYEANGLTHPGLPGESGGNFHHDWDSGNRSTSRTISVDPGFDTAQPGDEFWMVGLIQLGNHSGTSNIRLSNSASAGTSDLGFGVFGADDTNETFVQGEAFVYSSHNGSGGQNNPSGVVLNADGSTNLFIVQAIFGSGTSADRGSTINFWVNPADTSSLAALGTPDYTNTDSKFGRVGTYTSASIALSYQSRADEIRFGDSFDAVMIPEPGTLVLVGIALGSLCLFRRRR